MMVLGFPLSPGNPTYQDRDPRRQRPAARAPYWVSGNQGQGQGCLRASGRQQVPFINPSGRMGRGKRKQEAP